MLFQLVIIPSNSNILVVSPLWSRFVVLILYRLTCKALEITSWRDRQKVWKRLWGDNKSTSQYLYIHQQQDSIPYATTTKISTQIQRKNNNGKYLVCCCNTNHSTQPQQKQTTNCEWKTKSSLTFFWRRREKNKHLFHQASATTINWKWISTQTHNKAQNKTISTSPTISHSLSSIYPPLSLSLWSFICLSTRCCFSDFVLSILFLFFLLCFHLAFSLLFPFSFCHWSQFILEHLPTSTSSFSTFLSLLLARNSRGRSRERGRGRGGEGGREGVLVGEKSGQSRERGTHAHPSQHTQTNISLSSFIWSGRRRSSGSRGRGGRREIDNERRQERRNDIHGWWQYAGAQFEVQRRSEGTDGGPQEAVGASVTHTQEYHGKHWRNNHCLRARHRHRHVEVEVEVGGEVKGETEPSPSTQDREWPKKRII